MVNFLAYYLLNCLEIGNRSTSSSEYLKADESTTLKHSSAVQFILYNASFVFHRKAKDLASLLLKSLLLLSFSCSIKFI